MTPQQAWLKEGEQWIDPDERPEQAEDQPVQNDVLEAELLDEEPDPEDDDDDSDDARLREAYGIAPWSPIPTRLARAFIEQNEDAVLEMIFPEVYEEDRTAKIKDLATAQALGAISHQRMSEKIAKELGEESYNYDEEMEQIQQETQLLPQDQVPDIANPGPDPYQPPVAPQIGRSVVGLPQPGQKGIPTPGTINFGSPAPGLATERPGPGTGDNSDITAEPKRQDLSGTDVARFRKLQRQSVAIIKGLTGKLLEMERREIQSAEQLIRLFSGLEAQIKNGQPLLEHQLNSLLGQMKLEYERKMEHLIETLREATAKPDGPVPVVVTNPPVAVTPPPPPQAAEVHVHEAGPRPRTVIRTIHRDEQGLIARIEESEVPQDGDVAPGEK